MKKALLILGIAVLGIWAVSCVEDDTTTSSATSSNSYAEALELGVAGSSAELNLEENRAATEIYMTSLFEAVTAKESNWREKLAGIEPSEGMHPLVSLDDNAEAIFSGKWVPTIERYNPEMELPAQADEFIIALDPDRFGDRDALHCHASDCELIPFSSEKNAIETLASQTPIYLLSVIERIFFDLMDYRADDFALDEKGYGDYLCVYRIRVKTKMDSTGADEFQMYSGYVGPSASATYGLIFQYAVGSASVSSTGTSYIVPFKKKLPTCGYLAISAVEDDAYAGEHNAGASDITNSIRSEWSPSTCSALSPYSQYYRKSFPGAKHQVSSSNTTLLWDDYYGSTYLFNNLTPTTAQWYTGGVGWDVYAWRSTSCGF